MSKIPGKKKKKVRAPRRVWQDNEKLLAMNKAMQRGWGEALQRRQENNDPEAVDCWNRGQVLRDEARQIQKLKEELGSDNEEVLQREEALKKAKREKELERRRLSNKRHRERVKREREEEREEESEREEGKKKEKKKEKKKNKKAQGKLVVPRVQATNGGQAEDQGMAGGMVSIGSQIRQPDLAEYEAEDEAEEDWSWAVPVYYVTLPHVTVSPNL
jgi:hypothetical protein